MKGCVQFEKNSTSVGFKPRPLSWHASTKHAELPRLVNPIALRKAKLVYNFGPSECNRVKFFVWQCKRYDGFQQIGERKKEVSWQEVGKPVHKRIEACTDNLIL